MDNNVQKGIGDIMDWSKVVGMIAGAAPLVGSLFGPAGTAVGTVASAGIKLVASALGCEPTQEAITQVITADPNALLKIKELEINGKVEIQKLIIAGETAGILAVNATMQGESKSEHWPQYSWRPAWGFSSALAFLFVCILVCILAWNAVIGKDAAALGQIPLIIGAFATLFSIPGAILGIASWKRGQMQVESSKGTTEK